MKTGIYPYSLNHESKYPFEEQHFKSFLAAIKLILNTCFDHTAANRPTADDLLAAILSCKV